MYDLSKFCSYNTVLVDHSDPSAKWRSQQTRPYFLDKPHVLVAIIFPLTFPASSEVKAKYYELRASILRKLLKDAKAELEQRKKGKGKEKVGDLALCSLSYFLFCCLMTCAMLMATHLMKSESSALVF
ncbi:hypothetical protein RHGRI_003295 [Rhododendron griersonianum]|uniref:Uncharacterized protein n=1 Tax=Rhododendron griersonianum TaxID=479676 RepID=A0AAV6L678_9ERIC|nr:hypothetical protein RHGRI_003295 [Rhododendron griersonianum]